MQRRNSKLQQKEFALQKTRQELDEMGQRAEGAEATLELERAAFNEVRACLEDNLNRALVAQDEAEACE